MPMWIRGDVIDVRKIVNLLSEISRVHGLKVRFPKIVTAPITTLIMGPFYVALLASPRVTKY